MCRAVNLVTLHKVEINAPASLMCDALVNLAGYPQWNPYTVRVEASSSCRSPFSRG